MTIPLAMVVDYLIHQLQFSTMYLLGSCLVFCGFVMVNLKFSEGTVEQTLYDNVEQQRLSDKDRNDLDNRAANDVIIDGR